MFSWTDTIPLQRHQRETVEHGGNSVAYGKDTLLEQCWSVSSWNWRPGSRRVEPQRSEGVGDPSGLRGVCPRNQRLEVGGRAETLGRHPLDPQPSMWLAGSLAVCRSQVPPFPPNHASKRISGLRTKTRHRDARHHGILAWECPPGPNPKKRRRTCWPHCP